MATKPTLTYTFATLPVYTTGSFLGSPTKVVPPDLGNGFIPGEGVGAAHQNYMHSISGDWITDWLDLGSYNPDEDAHIVETDSDGKSSLAILELGGTPAMAFGLTVTANTGATGSAASFTNTLGGFAISASSTTSASAIRGTNSSTGYGLEGLALGTNNDGVHGQGQGTGSGVSGRGGSTGAGISGTGGATAGTGVKGTGGTNGIGVEGATAGTAAAISAHNTGSGRGLLAQADGISSAIRAVNNATGIGIEAEGGAGNYGLYATTTGAVGAVKAFQTTGTGVDAEVTSGIAVEALATTGQAITAESAGSDPTLEVLNTGTGHAAQFRGDTTSPTTATIRLWPVDDDPSSGAAGDLSFNTTTNEYVGDNGSIPQRLWATEDGMAFGTSGIVSGTNNNSGVYTVLGSATFYKVPQRAGMVVITASAEVGSSAAANTSFDIQIWDDTAGVPIYTQTVDVPNATAASVDRMWTATATYTLPAGGARDIQLRFKKAALMPSDAVAEGASITLQGLY